MATQPAKALTPYQGGVETVIPFALGVDSGKSVSISVLLGFLTSFVIYAFSSSRRAKKENRNFLGVLFTDFWFEGFVTPSLGAILLFILYSNFWGWVYFLIWATASGYVSLIAFFLSLLAGLMVYVLTRVMIESIVAITKTAESVNSILDRLTDENSESNLSSESSRPVLDNEKVKMWEDGKLVINSESFDDQIEER